MNDAMMTTGGENGAVQDAGELSVEGVRLLIAQRHNTSVPPDDPTLIMVTIMQAALNEEKRLQEQHRKKLAEVMNGMVNDLAEVVKKESAGIGDKLSGVAVDELQRVGTELRQSGAAVSERLSGHSMALYLCTGIMAVSALVNVWVFLVR